MWVKTFKALRGLLEILTCSKCTKSLHDINQFLECGHFSCISCMEKNEECNDCGDKMQPDTNYNDRRDSAIEKILQSCCLIAEEYGFGSQAIQTNDANAGNSKKINNKIKRKTKSESPIKEKKSKYTTSKKPFTLPKNINKTNHQGETVLLVQCKKNNLENVQSLLKASADPDIPCGANWTPLQESVDYHFYDVVEALLKGGATVNKAGHQGRFPLHEAAKNNDIEMVKILLNHNAKKDVEDDDKKTPYDLCTNELIKKMLKFKNHRNQNLTFHVESKSTTNTTENNERATRNQTLRIMGPSVQRKEIDEKLLTMNVTNQFQSENSFDTNENNERVSRIMGPLVKEKARDEVNESVNISLKQEKLQDCNKVPKNNLLRNIKTTSDRINEQKDRLPDCSKDQSGSYLNDSQSSIDSDYYRYKHNGGANKCEEIVVSDMDEAIDEDIIDVECLSD